jgi:two-component system chemotaxis sensor kinase CheA
MLQKFKNIQLKYKLITCFLLIIIINSISGAISINLMKHLGQLVNITYDKALMSGTFAQAVKFDFSQYDSEIKSAFLADNTDEYNKHSAKSNKAYKTLLEDLDVVKERALSTKSESIINDIQSQLHEVEIMKKEIMAKKEILLSKDSHKDANELGREWDANKLKNGLYKKITALYDDAAEVGYQFRLNSEEANKKNLNRTIFIIAACIFISIILSITVSYFIISPLLKLKNTCRIAGEGDYTVRSDIKSTDELGTLASSFNFMLNTIQDKTDSITSLLSSLPFALFYFDEHGLISKERSQSTDLIFNNFSAYKNLEEFFEAHHCNGQKTKEILRAIFQGLIHFESAVLLFPDILQVGDGEEARTVQLSFKPKYANKKKITRVIVLAEDITEKNKAMAESRDLTERVERVSRITTDITGFKEFLPSARELYSSALGHLEYLKEYTKPELKRDLHSLKGLLGIYAFNTCAEIIHEIESLIDSDLEEDISDGLFKFKNSKVLFEMQAKDVTDLLAINADADLKYFSAHKINTIKMLAQKEKNPEIIKAILDLNKFSLDKVLSKYTSYAQTIASKLEDKKVKVTFESSDEISYEEVQKLDPVFIHVLNNSIDHGIESSTERIEMRKDEVGEIKIACKRNKDNSLEFKISDDGRGIDADHLVQKALEKGFMSEAEASIASEEDKINLIFSSGFSTKENMSQISGRGVGLDAVRAYIESIGGSIRLCTEQNKGTTFTLHVPPLENT